MFCEDATNVLLKKAFTLEGSIKKKTTLKEIKKINTIKKIALKILFIFILNFLEYQELHQD